MNMNKKKNYQVQICCPLVIHFSIHLKIMNVIVKQLNFLLWVKEKEIEYRHNLKSSQTQLDINKIYWTKGSVPPKKKLPD